MPPPAHRDASPYLPPLLFSSCSNVITSLDPVAPTGCPKEIPLPFTFNLSSSIRKVFAHAMHCAAKLR